MKISFIGAGRLGTTLAVLLRRAGYDIAAVSSRTPGSCERFVRSVKSGKICASNSEAAALGEIVFITTNDDAIEKACVEASKQLRGKMVVHCSGALTTDVLKSARGAKKAAIHPMQAVPCVAKGIKSLPGSYFDVQCDEAVWPAARRLVHDIGGTPVRISKKQKIFNHVASCMISNYSVAIFTIALKLYDGTGISQKRATEMLMPLFEENVKNIRSSGAITSLTGPIQRGDIETVRRHLTALDSSAWIKALYVCLARSTLKLAEQKGLEAEKAAEIKALLKSHIVR